MSSLDNYLILCYNTKKRGVFMILLSCNDLKKEFGANKLFEGINLEIQEHDKIGLVGLNGCGKTTLLKMLQGEESVDKGSISISKGTKIGYLEQQPRYPNKSVKDVLLSAFKDINKLRARMNIIEENISARLKFIRI